MTDTLPNLMRHLLVINAQAAALAIVIGVIVAVFRNQLAPRWRHRLWWLVVLRLAIPVLPASPTSLYQWMPVSLANTTPTPVETHSADDANTNPSMTPLASSDNSTLHIPIEDPPQTLPSIDGSHAAQAQADAMRLDAEASLHALATSTEPGLVQSKPDIESNASSTSNRLDVWAWAGTFALWLIVAGLLLSRTLLSWAYLNRQIRRDARPASARALALLHEEAEALRCRQVPALLETSAVSGAGPALVGVARPRLLLPPGLAESLGDDALRLVLRHELCHLRSRDNLANWLLAVVSSLHWFNPLAWWAVKQLRSQRELARDAQTVRAQAPVGRASRPSTGTTDGQDGHPTAIQADTNTAQQYAEALLAVVRFSLDASTTPPRRASSLSSCAVRDRKHLSRRLAMLEHTDRFRLHHSLFASALLIVVAAVGLTTAQADQASDMIGDKAAEQNAPTIAQADQPQAIQDETPEALGQHLDVFWQGISFADALADLEDHAGLPITFDPAIQKAIDAIKPKRPVSMHLTDVPLESALQLLLDQQFEQRMRKALPPVDMRWTIQDGALHLAIDTRDMRVYDIRDLLVVRQPDPAEAPWSDEKIAETRGQYVGQVRELITTTVGDPRHWTDEFANTEFGGTITELNGNVIIKTTPENHRQIVSLLERLRETRAWMISFETKVMLLDDETFQEVFSEDVQIERWGVKSFHLVHPGRRGGAEREPIIGSMNHRSDHSYGIAGYAWLNEKSTTALVERVKKPGRNNYLYDPKFVAFNGHPLWFLLGTEHPYISGYSKAPDNDNPATEDGPVEPVLSTSGTGVLLLMQGTISSDRKYVTLKAAVEVACESGPPLRMPVPKVEWADEERTFIELPQIDYSTMRTGWWSQPDQNWMLLVGPTVRGKVGPDDPDDYNGTRRIVLMIKPTIIEQQEQEIETEEDAGDAE